MDDDETITETPTEPKDPGGRPIALAEPFGSLARTAGGVQKLADELGVTARTVQRWAKDASKIPRGAQKLIASLVEKWGIVTEPPPPGST